MRKSCAAMAALFLLLAGCAGAPTGGAAEFVPAATAQALLDSAAFSETLEALDADLITGVYGLTAEPKEAAVYTSTGATAEEVVVLTFEKTEDADAALTALTKRVADQREACDGYLPLELPKLDGAVVKQAGASVLLVVAADYDAVTAALDGLAK